MKVICVKTDYVGCYSSLSADSMLTIGKWYNVNYVSSDYYNINVDSGIIANLSKSYFKTIDQLRDDKLKELGL
jgi:hypothetical protein